MAASNWNLNLTAEQIPELKVFFDQWQELQERKKELAEENKQICQDAARICDGTATDASKIFKNMKMIWEGEEAEANNISLMLDKLQGAENAE